MHVDLMSVLHDMELSKMKSQRNRSICVFYAFFMIGLRKKWIVLEKYD